MAGEPIIVDLGRARSKRIKALKRGKGRLVSKVDQVLAEVSEHLQDASAQIVPIIVVYRKKRRRRRNRGFGLFG